MTHATHPPVEAEWRSRAEALMRTLTNAGAITDPAWKAAYAQVPRHMFVPCWWALDAYNRIDHALRADDPDHHHEWLDGIYSNRPLVTQWADDTFDGEPVRVPTSSASQPELVATMLDRLDVADRHRVLEIGTGTGYNAALLCARIGDIQVSSIDIHSDLVTTAADRLAKCGFAPHLHIGDGADPPGVDGGYDRIIATCAVSRIPTAWLDHLAPGGRIVTPLTFSSGLAVLDRRDDGTVSGHLDPYRVDFMPLRSSASDTTAPPTRPDREPALTHHGVTDLDPEHLDDPDFLLWLSLHNPDMLCTRSLPGTSGPVSKVVYTRTAFASVVPADTGWTVRQQGGRLWDTVEAAWRSFQHEGRPSRVRIVLTASHDTQFLALDTDDSRHRWPLP